jgi:hypothetical protein
MDFIVANFWLNGDPTVASKGECHHVYHIILSGNKIIRIILISVTFIQIVLKQLARIPGDLDV